MPGRLFLWGLVVSWVAGAVGMASALTLDVDSGKPSCQLQLTQAGDFCGHSASGDRLEGWPAVAVDTADSTSLISSGPLDQSALDLSSSPDNLGINGTPLAHSRGRVLAAGLRVVGGGGAEPEINFQALHFTDAYTRWGVVLRQKSYRR